MEGGGDGQSKRCEENIVVQSILGTPLPEICILRIGLKPFTIVTE